MRLIAVLLALVAISWMLGRGWVALAGGASRDPGRRMPLVTPWLAGLLALYLLLQAFQTLGLPWQTSTLFPVLLILAGLASRLATTNHAPDPNASGLGWGSAVGWGEAVAAVAWLVFLACTTLLWNVHPDFIYHWGLKGAKFYLAGGIDFEFLKAPWNGHVHPDYPNLLPSLFALTAVLGGGFRELPALLWSALFLILAVLAARSLLARLEVSRFALQAGVALTGLSLSMFGVGYLQAGGADWLILLAVLAGAAALAAPAGAEADLEIGLAAALAAASKIEGIPLAVLLLGVHLVRRFAGSPGEGRGDPPRLAWISGLARILLPTTLVAGLWAWQTSSHGLFQASNLGAFDPGRVGTVVIEMARGLGTVNWHGLPFALLALPFLLMATGAIRAIASVLLLQLAFYVYIYLTSPFDPQEYVATTVARLYFHLVPATLMLLIATADHRSRGSEHSNA